MFARAATLEDAYLKSGGGPLDLTGGQLWLRQSDHAFTPQGVAIIHANGVQLQGKQLTASDVSVFRLDDHDKLLNRIEATEATLGAGAWQFQKARVVRPEQIPGPVSSLSLPTDLTVARVQESFASPDTLSFWQLPGFISLLDRSGFSSIRHRLHFQALLALAAADSHDGSGVRGILHAAGAAWWRGTDDRQRRRGGFHAVPGVEDGGGVWSVRRAAGRARRLGTSGFRHDAGGRAVAAHGRRLSMARALWASRAFARGLLLGLLLVVALPGAARAQLGALIGSSEHQQGSRDQPVTFTADLVEYDRDNALVTAQGHVEAWQEGHVLHADKVTFDRNTGVMAAQGNVVLMEPDGQVVFADYAELTQDMKSGVLRDMRAILAENGRMAANGARRTNGELNEMSRVVYSTCNLCAKDPTRPPLWEIRALSAVQDLEHKKIEYQDAVMEMYGFPIGYMPYFWQVDPSVKRGSGLLIPTLGSNSHLGVFYAQPWYQVIDDQSDATITPMITSRAGPEVDVEYRRKFNNGNLLLNGSLGYFENSPQATIFGRGQFNIDDTWRWGFDIARGSSADYVRDFRLSSTLGNESTLLSSQIYAEGFGQGAYSRFDVRFYQTLNDVVSSNALPLVLPRYEYSYFGEPDALGGRLSIDAGAFNVVRGIGTNTRRVSLTTNWDRPFVGALGDLWTVKLHNDAAGYDASASMSSRISAR